MTKDPGGSDSKILFTYTALDSSCCVQYKYYRGNCTFIQYEMIIDIIMIRIWHAISSLNLIFKRGQGRLPYFLLLLGNISCHVIYQTSSPKGNDAHLRVIIQSEKKWKPQFFRRLRAAGSVVRGRIWPNFKLIQALMYVIITCKYEKDPIKNNREKVATPFFKL